MTVVNFPYRLPPKLPPDAAAEDLDWSGEVLVYPDDDGLRWIAEGVARNGAMLSAHGTKADALDAALDWIRRFNSGLHLLNRPPDFGGAS
jgi:hypothetical protein